MVKRASQIRLALLASVCFASVGQVSAQSADQPQADDEALRQQTVVVRGEFIPDEKRSSSEVANLIDERDFQLQGDSDAAAALARVAGISTAEDRFIYVRGLNERYSSALLNGSPLPSPEPLRRVAPLDLFPTSVLRSILVQKTYSPNLPGEFGGGLVDIRTKAIPDERFLEVSIGTGGNTETSFQDGLLYDGGDRDWLGFDDGVRDLPPIPDSGVDSEFGRQLTDNSSLLIIQEGMVGPDFDAGITGGDRYDLSADVTMGLLGSVSYSNKWSTRRGERGFGDADPDGGLSQREQYERFGTENSIGLNGFATLGFEFFDNHEVQFTGFVTRATAKEARSVQGTNFDDNFERIDSIEWFERELWTTQVQGTHYFPSLMDLKLEWRGSYSEATRDAPYQFGVLYQDTGAGLRTQPNSQDNRFQFSNIEDDATDWGFDLTLPLDREVSNCNLFCETELKAGYLYTENDRYAESKIFDIVGVPLSPNRVDYVYADVFANGGGGVLSVGGIIFPEAYQATLEVDAAYVGVDTQITPFIRAALGARYENGIEIVDTLVLDADPDAPNLIESCIDQDPGPIINGLQYNSCSPKSDILPAFTVTWNPIDDLQVRGGYSETITRPQFRELAPTEFVNTETDVNFRGNPFLVNAAIKNYDIRAEYYFARDQFLTLGFFYKDMERPIEEINNRSGDTPRTEFINVPSAELWGVELEYEQALPFSQWLEAGWLQSKEFTVKTNYTWSDSEVFAGRNPNELGLSSVEFCAQFEDECVTTNQQPLNPRRFLLPGAGLIEDGRRLQGQSEHLFNFQFVVSDEAARSDINILLNYASERIRSAEALSLNIPAILEKPPLTLDLVYNKGFTLGKGDYELSFNVSNILGEGYEAWQERGGDRVDVDVYDVGTSVSLGLKRSF
jgi:outer membrane receptor protein involved in Fe transport